ncbi:sulfur carrier protein ThiS [Actinokineospora sp. HUAS TT18]|uniref:sulfur carrier protein ThiS n=1 Tax=Actinokineospora sp. HUAS TT18 TaxID=3447451 RepID=UPI003F51F498
MMIKLNGESREVAEGTTVADLLAELSLPANGIAVAVDGEVVPRADHARTPVTDGAVVEILTAVQGG